VDAIPAGWRARLALPDGLETYAQGLLAASGMLDPVPAD
jgi:hypothetical protein